VLNGTAENNVTAASIAIGALCHRFSTFPKIMIAAMLKETIDSPVKRSDHSIPINGDEKMKVVMSDEITRDMSEKLNLLLENQTITPRIIELA
jgi:hypothetical protein